MVLEMYKKDIFDKKEGAQGVAEKSQGRLSGRRLLYYLIVK